MTRAGDFARDLRPKNGSRWLSLPVPVLSKFLVVCGDQGMQLTGVRSVVSDYVPTRAQARWPYAFD